ncbi:MAG: glycosyltransferase family 2 protein [Nitrosopumilus sp.]|nr:glycosyltransferase family 2 protein [Nitrosopumilus sp.]
MPLVSIIIVNWNAKKFLEDCINSLQLQTFTDFEIILVDNASIDDSVSFVKTNFPQVKIIENQANLGFAEGNNVGIANSTGKIIALFNPDAIADKNWLKILISAINDESKIAAVTGKMYYLGNDYGKNTVFCTWSKLDPISAVPTNFHNGELTSRVDYLSGAAMVIRRDVLNKIGFMDKDYFLYFEETDLCARMIRAGYDLMYIPDAMVWHAVSPLSTSENKIYFMERNRIRFVLKNFDFAYIVPFFFVFFSEMFYIFLRDMKNKNFLRTKTRFKTILWNLSNLKKTLNARKTHFSILKKNGTVHSYNKNLPLRSIKTKE